jgi:hypothetical protein
MNAKQISAAKTAELVAFYNECADRLGRKQVNKFADRKTAERRCTEIAAHVAELVLLTGEATKPAKAKAQWDGESCPSCGTHADQTAGRVSESGGQQRVVDEHVGQCHHCGHTYNVNTGKAAKFSNESANPERAAKISASWADPAVKAARVTRNSVNVNGVEYRSVREAFKDLGLPDSKHFKFRMDLKATGKQSFGGHVFVLGE